MFEAMVDGLLIVLQLKTFLYLMLGAGIGFLVGVLPGVGGAAGLALMIPFIYHMTPNEAFPFLLGVHSVVQLTGDITSILFGVPGEPTSVAIILDGHPLAKRGEAGRALGAAFASGLVGIGAGVLFLLLIIPIVRPLVLSFGSPEMFMVVVLGLTCVSSLSGHGARGLLSGLMCATLGFAFSLVGQDPQQGILRYTFGSLYLFNGISLVPLVVGFFAIPEIIDLAMRGTSIAGDTPSTKFKGVFEGIRDTFRNLWLVIRCGIISIFVGLMPGLGGSVAQWMSYAHATQTAKTTEERAGFGKGDIRGVLGAGASTGREAANLVPTVAFGVPGSVGMAVLLGAFMLMGILPGPDMLTKHLPLTYSLVWTIVMANIAVTLISLLLIKYLAKLTNLRGSLIIPFVLLLVFIGSYAAHNHIGDLIVTLVVGGLGYLMIRFGLPRPPFILGFILGRQAETYFFISTTRYDMDWLMRPMVILILIFSVAVALYPLWQQRRLAKKKGG